MKVDWLERCDEEKMSLVVFNTFNSFRISFSSLKIFSAT
jgi:hypothetical protein